MIGLVILNLDFLGLKFIAGGAASHIQPTNVLSNRLFLPLVSQLTFLFFLFVKVRYFFPLFYILLLFQANALN